jgi:hypothetical protein
MTARTTQLANMLAEIRRRPSDAVYAAQQDYERARRQAVITRGMAIERHRGVHPHV